MWDMLRRPQGRRRRAMSQDLTADEANQKATELFGAGSAVEAKADGFLVWCAPQPNASGAPEGMSLPRRELIGRGASRREALESARRALKK
jgi:hypothetical protein